MSLKLITFAVLLISVMVVCHPAPEGEVDKGMKQLNDFFTQLQTGVNNLVKTFSETDSFKQMQQFGDALTAKGKELQKSLTESLQASGSQAPAN